MILVDSSVWVDHFRKHNARLAELLETGQVLTHAFVVGEIALGSLKERNRILELLAELPAVDVATHDDVMSLVEQRRMWNRGIGWIDAHLLASAVAARVPLWTLDRRLAVVARELRAG